MDTEIDLIDTALSRFEDYTIRHSVVLRCIRAAAVGMPIQVHAPGTNGRYLVVAQEDAIMWAVYDAMQYDRVPILIR